MTVPINNTFASCEGGINGTENKLSHTDFSRISNIVYEYSGINMQEGKEPLVQLRLLKRMRNLGISNFSKYIDFIESSSGKEELYRMIDVMTANETSFFREPAYFDFIKNEVIPKLTEDKLRVWSAACSSGEEPYTLAIVLNECLTEKILKDTRILATDLSVRMLNIAKSGIYSEETIMSIADNLRTKYLSKVSIGEDNYKVSPILRRMVYFSSINLMKEWPMKGPFDFIMCSNAMIYFDRQTQERLLARFWDYVKPGGYLFVGDSEGLSKIPNNFHYVSPAVYRK